MEDLKNFLSQLFRQSSDLIHVLPLKSSLGNPLQTLGVFYRFVGIARCLIAILLFDANTPERHMAGVRRSGFADAFLQLLIGFLILGFQHIHRHGLQIAAECVQMLFQFFTKSLFHFVHKNISLHSFISIRLSANFRQKRRRYFRHRFPIGLLISRTAS